MPRYVFHHETITHFVPAPAPIPGPTPRPRDLGIEIKEVVNVGDVPHVVIVIGAHQVVEEQAPAALIAVFAVSEPTPDDTPESWMAIPTHVVKRAPVPPDTGEAVEMDIAVPGVPVGVDLHLSVILEYAD